MTNKRVVIFAPHFAPGFRAGGPLRSLVALVDTAGSDLDVLVVTSDRDLGDERPYSTSLQHPMPRGRHSVLYVAPLNPRDIVRWLRTVRSFKPSAAYINSLWNPGLSILPALAMLLGAFRAETVAVAPRGQLNDLALTISARRKRLMLHFWRLANQRFSIIWHATESMEARLIRDRIDADSRVAISMNPVNLPRRAKRVQPLPSSRLRILYVGRIARIKNVRTMITGIVDSQTDAEVTLIGHFEDPNYLKVVLAAGRPLGPRFQALGPLPHEEVLNAFGLHDVMFFPSLSESFGHVIPEALSMSCPVVAGRISPFTAIVEGGGGEVIDHTDPSAWTTATRRWSQMSLADLSCHRDSAALAYNRWTEERDRTHILSIIAGLERSPN